MTRWTIKSAAPFKQPSMEANPKFKEQSSPANSVASMNPVDLIDHPLRHSDIDYGFRPSSYWEPPADVLAAVLRNVKGTERRAMITDHFREGRLDELLPELTCDELNQEERERLGRIHPSFMGGEYLPGYRANEVEIVRMEFKSTTADVICVRARPVGRKKVKIEYRVVDET
jgi:hypothetical protein